MLSMSLPFEMELRGSVYMVRVEVSQDAMSVYVTEEDGTRLGRPLYGAENKPVECREAGLVLGAAYIRACSGGDSDVRARVVAYDVLDAWLDGQEEGAQVDADADGHELWMLAQEKVAQG